ncbi:hypothetical protein [Symbioplanes lichenis]|uniref:hypothetical protein n=1 Tax=Symbioplanes lichenis TaxID=1629072 RepID=UPI002738DCB2|nr:hypothetical protein [Actinoplanes lichenis]
MHDAIVWCGFFGAWLLVAGPVHQAALELGEERLEVEEIERIADASAPPPVSAWWWLFPPMLYVRHRQRDAAMREMLLSRLTPRQVELMLGYLNKATGWLLVGLGGLLIAAKETWELCEHYEAETWVFWVLVVVALLAALANAGLRMRRGRQIVERRRDMA